ncbi:uncharacterized protein UV8b_04807 [Ustilaginoidea virens]|uniref:AB hydrolase-1 domain-containing protein n=1 Tax=Ustilaginoidea virens TaxID=1159556 RepID=A0A063BR39_USTVR|nr:uncharacterized protein UV8b_04807 [Ustilaginoidea virens]QUC20566.1 hypothetical protein UV8b_04807 [Ustilaginoidea virens]GAO15628.1 hypothetical protein UVI_02050590 [Ustilaginoidea virens]
MDPAKLPRWHLPDRVSSRFVDTSPAGLKFHVLESVPDQPPEPESGSNKSLPPLILLLHGFPNLSYDWRYVLPKLAAGGCYAVAFDLRGFGRTHNADLTPIPDCAIHPMAAVCDVVTLVHALGYTTIRTLVGHDLGAYMAAITALVRPDMVESLLLLAHTWKGIANVPLGASPAKALASRVPRPLPRRWEGDHDPHIQASLARLDPPRKHYKWDNASPGAADEWTYPAGPPLREFLRGYFHLKSGAHAQKIPPRPLKSWTAQELAILPHYYVMRADKTMRENVALDMREEPRQVAEGLSGTPWLAETDVDVYEREFTRTTFRAPLLWYRVLTDPERSRDLLCLAGSKIRIPAKYVSGVGDWGTYQIPGGLEAMQEGVSVEPECWRGATLVPGAGHWVNVEKPDESALEILELARSVASKPLASRG